MNKINNTLKHNNAIAITRDNRVNENLELESIVPNSKNDCFCLFRRRGPIPLLTNNKSWIIATEMNEITMNEWISFNPAQSYIFEDPRHLPDNIRSCGAVRRNNGKKVRALVPSFLTVPHASVITEERAPEACHSTPTQYSYTTGIRIIYHRHVIQVDFCEPVTR